ncbi:MAG: hypothetical protein LQ338_007522 [Usnochroma carphineum]|nr:MAG: hypothetical protein LQ338_007522 [Usnochroma carphineum]
MSSSQNSRKLLKNRNNLVDGVQHLRPRGSYDPLPPPGGYPLPASIRKKFSFAPQLPNLSTISLIPDFASSSLGQGIQLDDSEAKRISKETPTSLYVHYSLLSLSETLDVQQPASLNHRLPRPDTTILDQTGTNPPPKDDDTFSISSFRDTETWRPPIRPSRSLRRVQGRASLQTINTSSPLSDSDSESPTLSSLTESTEPSSPRTIVTPSDEDRSNLSTQILDSTDCATPRLELDERESRLVKRLAHDCPNLFRTFFIIDLQIPENLVRVTSHDILPTGLAPDEVLFYDDDLMEIPYKLMTTFNGEQKVQTLPFEGDLVANGGTSSQPTHRFVGQIDLTNFLEKELEENEDVWLMIAYEEMEKAGIRRRGGRPMTNPASATPHAEAEQVPRVIQSLHYDYFVIGYFSTMSHFRITLVSPTLSSKEVNHPGFLDWTRLKSHLSTPERFVTRVHRQAAGLRDKLYCVPMFGPELVCWLCFLVDGDLPEIWPSSQDDKI